LTSKLFQANNKGTYCLWSAITRSALSGVPNVHNAKLIDLQSASIDLRTEGSLTAPIPRTTHRNYLTESAKVKPLR